MIWPVSFDCYYVDPADSPQPLYCTGLMRCDIDGFPPCPFFNVLAGLDMVLAAIVHGFILSLLVPILIAFFSA